MDGAIYCVFLFSVQRWVGVGLLLGVIIYRVDGRVSRVICLEVRSARRIGSSV